MRNNLSSILIDMWQKANIEDNEMLGRINNLSDFAEMIATHSASLASAVGCLISDDDQTGVLRTPGEISTLLFHFADQFEMIKALSFIGGEADYRLQQQKK
jgi:hypothetical protein